MDFCDGTIVVEVVFSVVITRTLFLVDVCAGGSSIIGMVFGLVVVVRVEVFALVVVVGVEDFGLVVVVDVKGTVDVEIVVDVDVEDDVDAIVEVDVEGIVEVVVDVDLDVDVDVEVDVDIDIDDAGVVGSLSMVVSIASAEMYEIACNLEYAADVMRSADWNISLTAVYQAIIVVVGTACLQISALIMTIAHFHLLSRHHIRFKYRRIVYGLGFIAPIHARHHIVHAVRLLRGRIGFIFRELCAVSATQQSNIVDCDITDDSVDRFCFNNYLKICANRHDPHGIFHPTIPEIPLLMKQ